MKKEFNIFMKDFCRKVSLYSMVSALLNLRDKQLLLCVLGIQSKS